MGKDGYMIEGIILAAGYSARMGQNKMLLEFKNKTILETCLDNMLPYVDRIYLVCGHDSKFINLLVKDYKNVSCVYNEDYNSGMITSIKTGIQHLSGQWTFLMPGDMPLVKGTTFEALIKAEGSLKIPSYKYQGGHPIYVKTVILKKLLNSQVASLRDFLNLYEKTYVSVEDQGVCIDLDTKEDYKEHIL